MRPKFQATPQLGVSHTHSRDYTEGEFGRHNPFSSPFWTRAFGAWYNYITQNEFATYTQPNLAKESKDTV
ncbi:hypothetical protein CGMCC3_g6908 [Colletotrichum fructicola]|nr:uncharacterized protein CGMCC3_g6908 [Colletotrichum fructicola]KAE9577250.1 hypothetical protein CGMCC3_g6908 [Colletotrichum fructicola]